MHTLSTDCPLTVPFTQEGEEERRESDDDFLDDGEEVAEDDPPDLYYNPQAIGQQNGDQDDHWDDDYAAEEEYERDFEPMNTCMECGEEVGATEQMCYYCTRKSFRRAGAPSGFYH